MKQPHLVVTGASGFIGRHLLEALKDRYRITGMARRSQATCGAPVHDNLHWCQVDVGDRESLAAAFVAARELGPVEAVIHLAAHYDFSGEDHGEYWRTNVDGLRNVLEACAPLGLRRFIFASSVAACRFPAPGSAIDETTPPAGRHTYAITKRIGEEMLAEYDDSIPARIIRFAALFSDWCEYPPLYAFLQTWLSRAWNARVLGGRGASAIPYLHIRDAVRFVLQALTSDRDLDQRQVLIASPDGAVSHRRLFDLATLSHHGYRRRPLQVPWLLCQIGVRARDLVGRILGDRPFERPWMLRYLDKSLTVDARLTRELLDWSPRPRLTIERRMPFLIENLKTDPVEWHRRNHEALKQPRVHSNLRVYKYLERHHNDIRDAFIAELETPAARERYPSYQQVDRELLSWRYTVVLRHLLNAVRSGDKGVFTAYCRDLAARRQEEGFAAAEVCGVLMILNQIAVERLLADPEAVDLRVDLSDQISMTVQFGCDQIEEVFEEQSR